MKTRKQMLAITISVTLALLLFLPVSAVKAGNPSNPPEEGEHLRGPAVIGEFTFIEGLDTDEGDPTTDIFFNGECKGTSFTANTNIELELAMATEEYISHFRISQFGLPDGCGPEYYSGLLIHKVLEFDDSNPESIQAKVIMLFVVLK